MLCQHSLTIIWTIFILEKKQLSTVFNWIFIPKLVKCYILFLRHVSNQCKNKVKFVLFIIDPNSWSTWKVFTVNWDGWRTDRWCSLSFIITLVLPSQNTNVVIAAIVGIKRHTKSVKQAVNLSILQSMMLILLSQWKLCILYCFRWITSLHKFQSLERQRI